MTEIEDKGFIPEEELIRQFWPDKVQPVTSDPTVSWQDGKLVVSCATKGASIGYKFTADEEPWTGWRIYNMPVDVPEGEAVKVITHRIGYAPSDTVVVKN